MLMEEVLHYQCFIRATEYRITLKGMRFRPLAELVFRRGEVGQVAVSGGLPAMLMGKDDYLRCVDLLRNERPVFVEQDPDSGDVYLRTGDEPVGENE